jgi:CBS domain-containing protein
MRAHQIMTKPVISITLDTSIVDAAKIMLTRHISGLPIPDGDKLVGIVSEGDSIRRGEMRATSIEIAHSMSIGRASWTDRHQI